MSETVRFLFVLGILVWGHEIAAQRLGLLPPTTRWEQLVHDSLRIIYPAGQEATARRVASMMLKTGVTDPVSNHCRYKPISVLLQPRTNIANGYVGLAPYRSEFYLQPHENPFRLGSLPWADLLAIHEMRHVQQVNAANTGLSHLVKFVFGDLVYAGMYNLAIPDWYREGDAVYAETKFTKQGRGRLSLFTLPFRERLKTTDAWEYYTVRNGSFRMYTPDHYSMGYLMVQYGNRIFGEATWDTIVKRAPRFEKLFGPFSGVMRENYGRRNKGFYQDAMKWYQHQWKQIALPEIVYPEVSLLPRDRDQTYFDMQYSQVDEAGRLFAAVTTFDRTMAICQLSPNGRRKKIVSVGLQQNTYFDTQGDRFVWTELRYDPRWARMDKNVIVVYDRRRSLKYSIRPDKGYFMPSLDSTGDTIIALHTDEKGLHQLHLLSSTDGRLLHSFPNPDNLYLGYPQFAEDGRSIIATARNVVGQMCIIRQDRISGEFTQITPYSYAVLGRPNLQGHWIYLTAGWGDLDQVYAVDLQDGTFYQMSGGNSAHYDPVWDPVQEDVVCTQYRLDGSKLVRLSGNPDDWKRIETDDGVKPVQGATTRNFMEEPEGKREFAIKPYSPWANAINVHSWRVTADDPVWGVQVQSDNILNNIALTTGYEYNRNTKAEGPYLQARLGIWYPEILMGISRTSREIRTSDGRQFRVTNDRVNAGLALPLVFTPGVYQQALRLSSNYFAGFGRLRPRVEGIDDFRFNYITHRAQFVSSRLRAYRQAMPSWGQRFDVSYSHEVTGATISQLYMATDVAVPGVGPAHYLILHAEYMRQDIREGSIQLGSLYAGARGFDVVDGTNQYRVGFTYGFPLWYPDMGFGNIFYSRRIRLQPFFDLAYTDDERFTFSGMKSLGAELLVDFDFPPVSIGLRYARLLEGYTGNANRFELFIPSQRF